MAKPTFNKLKVNVNKETKTLTFGPNNIEIEIKQYLPIQEKLALVSSVLNDCSTKSDLRFFNVGQIEMFTTLEIVYHYTNIAFTDNQLEKPTELYDKIISSGLYDAIKELIPVDELYNVDRYIWKTIPAIYDYQNSIYGIMDALANDYSKMDLDASKIQEKLSDPENMALLKDTLSKLG